MATLTTSPTAGGAHGGTAVAPGSPSADLPRPHRSARDVVVDVVVLLLCLLSGLLLLTAAADRTTGAPVPLELGVLLSATAAMWWRRRWPVALAVILMLASAWLDSTQTPSALALFTVAVHRGPRVLAGVVALALATGALYLIVLRPETGLPWWAGPLVQLVGVAAIAGWGTAVRHRRALLASWRERAERAEAEQHLRVDQARQVERTRIAREMHDVLAHRISLISMHAGALEYRPDATPDQVATAAGVVRHAAHQALDDLREVLGVLRSSELGAVQPRGVGPSQVEPPQPSLGDLPALVAECRRAGVRVDLSLEVPSAPAPEQVGRTAYRVAQEGLTNARKHAPGARVQLTVRGEPGGELEVCVRNPRGVATGSPLTVAVPGSGTGLVGLSERVVVAGGRLAHGWRDGCFELQAVLPWPRP